MIMVLCFGDKNTQIKYLRRMMLPRLKLLAGLSQITTKATGMGFVVIVVFEGLPAKLSQNEDLKKQLKATENCVLAECAVNDKIWGIGLSMKNPNRFEIDKWNWQSLLRYALMMVRERF